MRRYADGDGAAFEALFRRYEPRAYAYFLRRTGSAEHARDLFQELFLHVHRARDRYDPARPFAPWFFQIAHHLLVDDRRRAFHAREVPLGQRDPAAPGAGADEQAARRELLDGALRVLSPEERCVLVAAKLGSDGYPELAARLGKSVEAVRQIASRCLRRVRLAALAKAAGERGAG
jgi:RNA polymerase sigma-70 factor (ECF subfamily)